MLNSCMLNSDILLFDVTFKQWSTRYKTGNFYIKIECQESFRLSRQLKTVKTADECLDRLSIKYIKQFIKHQVLKGDNLPKTIIIVQLPIY